MRRSLVIVGSILIVGISLLASGCTQASAAAWAPGLVVHGALVQQRRSGASAHAERWDWRVGGELRWQLGADSASPPPPAEEGAAVPLETGDGSPCRVPTLCAWERRARARALLQWR